MNKSALKNVFFVLLLAATILIVFIYILSLRKQVMQFEGQKEGLIQSLEKEKKLGQEISRENSLLRDNLRASYRKISQLIEKDSLAQRSLEELNSKVSILKAENKVLREEKEGILKENESLRAKIGSAAEIKKAIGQLKRQVREVGRQIRQKAREGRLGEGNRGYLIKDGKSTYPATVKIEVVPAPEQ